TRRPTRVGPRHSRGVHTPKPPSRRATRVPPWPGFWLCRATALQKLAALLAPRPPPGVSHAQLWRAPPRLLLGLSARSPQRRRAPRTPVSRAIPARQHTASPTRWRQGTRSLAILADEIRDGAPSANARDGLGSRQPPATPLNTTSARERRQPFAHGRGVGDEASHGAPALGDHDRLAVLDFAH